MNILLCRLWIAPLGYCALKAKATTPDPHRDVLENRSSLVLKDYHNLGDNDESTNMLRWTVSGVGITLNLFAGSVAEVFGLLLDILMRRLGHAKEVVVAM